MTSKGRSNQFAMVHDFDLVLNLEPGFGTTALISFNKSQEPADALRTLIESGTLSQPMIDSYKVHAHLSSLSMLEDIARCAEHALYEFGSITKQTLVDIKAKLLVGFAEKDMYPAARSIRITPGSRELISWANLRGGYQLLISDTWDPIVKYWARELGITGHVEGHHPEFDNGIFNGQLRRINKKDVIFSVLRKKRIPFARVCAIDDSSSNLDILEPCGLSIGFGPTSFDREKFIAAGYSLMKELRPGMKAKIIVDKKDLCEVRDIIEKWLRANNYVC
jgi:phosphoserine phosphatase